jgi:hypothetical protein
MIERDYVLKYLQDKQETEGGYTGNDLTAFAQQLGVTERGLRKRISNWINNYKEFKQLIYLGKEKPSITLSEFLEIEYKFSENPIQVKNGIFDEIQRKRDLLNLEPLSKSTYYRKVNQTLFSQYSYEKEYRWFESEKITIPEDYSMEKNRDYLLTLFTFSDMKTYGGADLNAICERLTKSKEWFSMYDVKADRFYSQILTRNRFLKNILTSIHPNQKVGAQIRLFFELQAAFVIECMDFFIDEIIHKQGRMRQSDNASRQKTENKFRKEALEKLRKDLKQLALSEKIEPNILIDCSNVLIDEELQMRIELLKNHSDSCQSIMKMINSLTSNITQGVKFHRNEAQTAYRLATGEITWNTLNENEKRTIAWNPDFAQAIDNSKANIVPVIAFNRFIDYIRKGKITFEESYYYQDIGQRIQNIELLDDESYLTPDILEQLSEGTFQVDTNFLRNLSTTNIEASDEEVPSSWTNLSDILKEVSLYVRTVNSS